MKIVIEIDVAFESASVSELKHALHEVLTKIQRGGRLPAPDNRDRDTWLLHDPLGNIIGHMRSES